MLGKLPSFHQGIRIVSFCPLCETKFQIKRAKVIEENEDGQLLHMTCSKCKTSILAVINLTQTGLTTMGVVSDLASDEVQRYQSVEEIEADELLNFYRGMKKDPFKELFDIN